jgi:acetylornithine deacetylase/succinyl-diaminopimelate desuccinylase-like protein
MIDEAARKKRRHRNERIAAAIVVLIAAALTLAAFVKQRRETREALRDASYIPKPEVITPEIEKLREYVRIDTTSEEGISRGARWIAAELEKRGVKPELIESTPGHLNVYARIKGRKPGGALLLMNHIDVVAPGDGWSQPPFEGTIRFNELYGRGTLDMKALAIAQLLAFANLARSGRVPEHDLVFLATAEEERGSENGLLWLLAHRPDVIEGVETGITEGGLAETMNEKMVYFGIEIGGKTLATLILTAPDAEALRRARFRLEPFINHRRPEHVGPGIREFFRDLAPTRHHFGQYLADIDRTIARGEFWRLPETYREFVQNTMRATAPYPDGGQWSMRVTMLNLPDTNPDERIAWLRSQIEPLGIRVSQTINKQGPIPLTAVDTPAFRLLAGQAKRQYGVQAGRQVLYQAITDCRFLRMRGITCYGISPYPVNIFQAKSIHRADERIRLDWFRQGVEYVDGVVRTWAAAQ